MRFQDLRKIPDQPALRLLAMANVRLALPQGLPASASVAELLAGFAAANRPVDMIRLLSVALPGRERVWWACLAARDYLRLRALPEPRTLASAEAWVRRPGEETRRAVQAALETADTGDDLSLVALSALYAEGTLGVDRMQQLAAPPGGSEAAAFGVNILAIEAQGLPFPAAADRLIDRALDIARGGTGQNLPAPAPATGEA